MPYQLALDVPRNVFLTTMNLSLTVSSLITALGLSGLGLIGWETLWISLLGVGVVYLSVTSGERLRERLSPEAFRRAVLAMLALMGAGLALRAL